MLIAKFVNLNNYHYYELSKSEIVYWGILPHNTSQFNEFTQPKIAYDDKEKLEESAIFMGYCIGQRKIPYSKFRFWLANYSPFLLCLWCTLRLFFGVAVCMATPLLVALCLRFYFSFWQNWAAWLHIVPALIIVFSIIVWQDIKK